MKRRWFGSFSAEPDGAYADTDDDDAARPTTAPMTWQTALLMLLVALWAVTQYGLAAHAIMDLRRRPTVRGDNKVVWALVILGIPIVGALAYAVYGPTSFTQRDRPITTVPTVPASAVRPTNDSPMPPSDPSYRQPPPTADGSPRPTRSSRAVATDRPGHPVRPDRPARPSHQLPSIAGSDDPNAHTDAAPVATGITPTEQQPATGDRRQRRSPRP